MSGAEVTSISSVQGTVYLIHFATPYRHARHYLGWTAYLDARLAHHRAGTGARLMAVVSAAGIDWWVVATWTADRNFERRMKNNGSLARSCPVCSERPRFAKTAILCGEREAAAQVTQVTAQAFFGLPVHV